MHREPSLTYLGSLKLLGHHDPRIEKLNDLLGGVIIASGVAAAAAIAAPVLAPVGAVAAIWGWVDQKNEAVGLLTKIVNGVSRKLAHTNGIERCHLIAAAHTAIVAGTFFEVLHEKMGKKGYAQLEITARDRLAMTLGESAGPYQSLVERLYTSEVPAPSSARGFQENIPEVHAWLDVLAERVVQFLSGLAAWQHVQVPMRTVVDAAVERYRTHYLQLAATVPEFMIWATLGEHAATREVIQRVRADVRTAFNDHALALSRVESLLSLSATGQVADLAAVLGNANRGVLNEPVVRRGTDERSDAVTFPSIGQIYVNPRYRIAAADPAARPADESWWQDRPIHDDLDILLAAHLTSVNATRVPLLLLGHPGAGKSMLTKVLAARLPSDSYTVVRVPLRRVGANKRLYEQIQQALDQSTHGRVEWAALAAQSRQTVRVIMLDGLDELLQASGVHHGDYLQLVAEFQQREADQGLPVVVLVTSRTLVADRVEIPPGTVVVKLEDFDDRQISVWLDVWHQTNASAIAAGEVGELALGRALQHRELATQPLLLMLLALYSSDPKSLALDADMATGDLYRRLLRTFARREALKSPDKLSEPDLTRTVERHLRQLGVAALGMFNRGRQDIAESELSNDITALRISGVTGYEVIGSFYFIHAAEAQLSGSGGTSRCYEFMHATFGEYLLASEVIIALRDLAHTAYGGSRAIGEFQDHLLHALLSHQPLAGSRPTLTFAAELFAELTQQEQHDVLRTVNTLIGALRHRDSSDRYAAYQPLGIDHLRQLSTYSANLVLLRVVLEPSGEAVPLTAFWPDVTAPWVPWRSIVALWRSGLEVDGWHAMLSMLRFSNGSVREAGPNDGLPADLSDVLHARLIDDSNFAARLRLGIAVHDRTWFRDGDDAWSDVMLSWAVCLLTTAHEDMPKLPDRPDGATLDARVASLVWIALKQRARRMTMTETASVMQYLLDSRPSVALDPHAVATAVAAHPELLEEFELLRDPAVYDSAPGVPLILLLAERVPGGSQYRLTRLREMIERHRLPGGAGGPKQASAPENSLIAMARDVVSTYLR